MKGVVDFLFDKVVWPCHKCTAMIRAIWSGGGMEDLAMREVPNRRDLIVFGIAFAGFFLLAGIVIGTLLGLWQTPAPQLSDKAALAAFKAAIANKAH